MSEQGTTDTTLWLDAVSDPALRAAEERIGELYALESEQYRLARELEGYFWNSGNPYTTLDLEAGVWMGREATRMSFVWDRPAQSWQLGTMDRLLRRDRFLNNDRIRGEVLHDVDNHVRIVRRDGKQFFVRDKEHVISPKFDSVLPNRDGSFTVTSGDESGTLHILTPEEQEKVLEKRAHHDEHDRTYDRDEIREMQYEVALATLALYGVAIDPEETERNSASNVKKFSFSYAGNYVDMDIWDGSLDVMSWGLDLTRWERYEVQDALHSENGVRDLGMQLSILRGVIERGAPDWLKPYEDRIIADAGNIEAQNKFFLTMVRELFERNNFRTFSIDTPHPSWSIPVAMRFLRMSFDESYPFIAPYGTEASGSFYQTAPGSFHAGFDDIKRAWAIDGDGSVVEKAIR